MTKLQPEIVLQGTGVKYDASEGGMRPGAAWDLYPGHILYDNYVARENVHA